MKRDGILKKLEVQIMPQKFNPDDPKLNAIIGTELKYKILIVMEKENITATQAVIKIFTSFFEVMEI